MSHPQREATRIRILVDTREQLPWSFKDLSAETEREALPAGDYAIAGVPFVIERKTPEDFLASITHGRQRLERELERIQAQGGGAVVVEGSLDAVLYGAPNRRLSRPGELRVNPNSVLGSIASFQMRYHVPTYFASSRQSAQRLAWYLLEHARREQQELDSVQNEVSK
ncbi:MAG: ERCC4 domain-containing protein [Planctomycetes bacterium]|nr:ERCC4 domain-containing protein [Planctomycetota bacterium]